MDSMEQIVSLALNSGLAIVITVYFLLRDWKFQGQLTELMGEFRATLESIKDMIAGYHHGEN